ncbi:MAG TPA: phage tail sheath C-terminal domain-containing protein [Longimicrobium sp.]|nr:phage tail sheath C-terminal domain-containing protein [Longimicrobium sp.]
MSTPTTPGVYINELSAFPPSVVGVQTAVPCFIGYTQKAEIDGKPALLKPVRISSLAAFEAVFGGAYAARYAITPVANADEQDAHFQVMDPTANPPAYRDYGVEVQSSFVLYNSMRLFYANGGGNCYVVSVGPYETDGTPTPVRGDDLIAGLNAAANQVGITLLAVPDAVLLPGDEGGKPWESADFTAVAQAMLAQAATLGDRMAILDVYGTGCLTPPAQDGATLNAVIGRFRQDVGERGLSYGAAYFPFVEATVVQPSEVDYTSLVDPSAGGGEQLRWILSWENRNLYGDPVDPRNTRAQAVQANIDAIATTDPADRAGVRALNDALLAELPLLGQIEGVVAQGENVLPSSGAMAGVMTYADQTRGVWNAPANVSLTSVTAPTVLLDNSQQEGLNVPVDGKAVDALREFPGRGTVVWGARTLDGNNNDYRYIQVRRTVIYIEQSIKNALNQFAFAPNTGQTWTSVVSMVSSFLTTLWSQGGLLGATAREAFSVECGVGSTMTGQDVLDGYMIVQVTLQMIRPAEYIELTFKQKMEGVG